MLSWPATRVSLPSLFSILPASYLGKSDSVIYNPLAAGFTDRENGAGDGIAPGRGRGRMIR